MTRVFAVAAALMLFGCAAGEPPTGGHGRPAGSDVWPMSGTVSDSGAYPQVGGHMQFSYDGYSVIRIQVGAVGRAGEEWSLGGSVVLDRARATALLRGETVSGAPYGLMYEVGGTHLMRDIDGLRLLPESTGRATLELDLGTPRSLDDGVGRIVESAEPTASARFEGRFNVTCAIHGSSGAVTFDPRFETAGCRDLAVEVGLAATPLMPL